MHLSRRFPSLGPGAVLLGGAALAAVGLARSPQTGAPPSNQTQAIPVLGGSATSDSNGRMVAVTGVDVTGASVLYLIDTLTMRLCVYQASSTGANQGVRFVGARRIELDVELNGYNDKSEWPYATLLEQFEKNGLVGSGAAGPGSGGKSASNTSPSAPQLPGSNKNP